MLSHDVSVIISLIIAIIAGISVSFTSFVLARILKDLHAIRINTDGFGVEHEREDYSPILRAMELMNENIERIQDILYDVYPEVVSNDDGEEYDTHELSSEVVALKKDENSESKDTKTVLKHDYEEQDDLFLESNS